eukprot:3802589-Rhodomonas_salina.1
MALYVNSGLGSPQSGDPRYIQRHGPTPNVQPQRLCLGHRPPIATTAIWPMILPDDSPAYSHQVTPKRRPVCEIGLSHTRSRPWRRPWCENTGVPGHGHKVTWRITALRSPPSSPSRPLRSPPRLSSSPRPSPPRPLLALHPDAPSSAASSPLTVRH